MNKESGNEEASTTTADTLTIINKKNNEEKINLQDDNNIDESNSSLDTLTGSSEAQIFVDNIDKIVEKKKGRFGSFKNTLFKTKKKNKSFDCQTSTDVEFYEDDSTAIKEINNKTMDDNQIKESVSSSTSTTNQTVKKMMKKRKSIVRKLSLNKFRIGTSEQDKQETQSDQSSPSSSDTVKSILNKTSILKNSNNKNDKLTTTTTTTTSTATPMFENCKASYTTTGGQYKQEKGVDVVDDDDGGDDDDDNDDVEYFIDDPKKPDKFHEKTVKTITLLQTDLPSSVTIGTGNTQHTTVNAELKNNIESVGETTTSSSSSTTTDSLKILPTVTSSPNTLSKSSEEIIVNKKILKKKLNIKSESESSVISSEKPTIELRKKLSLLDEKRAIFQKKYFESYSKDDSICTVIDKNCDSIDQDIAKKISRHISVRNFDGLSTIEGADYNDDDDEEEEDISGYIEKNIDIKIDDKIDRTINTPRSLSIMSTESTDMPRRLSGDSGSTHNSVPNSGIGEKREHLYKILVIGELGAGKTSIIKRYVHQFFSQHYRATIGVDFALKVLNWDPHTIIRLQLWDIAGQERFGNMTRVYYKEAVGAFIVFDVTRSATLEAVVKWKQDLDSKVQLPDGSPIPCVLLANKCDQQKEGIVNTPGKMDDYCKEKNFSGWFETSAKENINIEEAARFLVNKILQNDQLMKGNGEQDQTDGERFALNQSPTNSKKTCSC